MRATRRQAVAARVLLGALAALLVGARAFAEVRTVRVTDVRLGVHPRFTRVVFELDGPAAWSFGQEQAAAGAAEVVVHLGARGAFDLLSAMAEARIPRKGLVESVRLRSGGAGGVARIALRTVHPILRVRALHGPPRIVVDVSDRGSEPRTLLARETPEERERREELTERPEEKRPAESLAVPVLGRPLVLSGDLESRIDYDGDRRLGRDDDDRARLSQELELELFYEIDPHWSLFAEAKTRFDWDLYREGGGSDRDWRVRRGETWLHAEDLGETGLGFEVGRVNPRDEREWWWDENLDGIRLLYDAGPLEAGLFAGQELLPEGTDEGFVDPEQEDVLRLIGHVGWRYARRHGLELFFLGQHDHSRRDAVGRVLDADREDEVDADLGWLGLRASGEWALGERGALRYWGDVGGVYGEERVLDFDGAGDDESLVADAVRREVLGFGLDAGLRWETPLPGRPSLTFAYAFGSGDPDADDEGDGGFRQTGLQDNDGRPGGYTRVRYYGELFDPELSNLHVATAAIDVPFLGSSSLALLYHYYHQARASAFLRNAGLRAQPGGRHGSLGHGFDAVLQLEEWRRVRLEVVGSLFRAGPAFEEESGELAFGGGLKLELGF